MGDRRFVAIVDNGTPMKCNVYRAEATLLAGEQRLFAQTKPFGDDPLTTRPGCVRMRLNPDANFQVANFNPNISVPTLVSKMSNASQTVY